MALRPFAAAAALSLLPSFAAGAGFEHPDQGAVGLGRAGAFAATADDLTALAYNPAGLAVVDGVRLLVDGTLAWHSVRFRRREGPYTRCVPDPAGGAPRCASDRTDDTVPLSKQSDDGAVSNQDGAFLSGFGAAAYGISLGKDRTLAIALGFYGPPAVGRYSFPAPDYSDANWDSESKQFGVDPRISSPQRYALVKSDIFIGYPSLAVAYRHADWLSFGASLQYVMFDLKLTQALTDAIPLLYQNASEHPGCDVTVPGTCGPDRMREEDPSYDSLVSLTASAKFTFTGVLGVLVKPHPRVRIGASYRPGFKVKADGKITLQPSRLARSLGVEVVGDSATLELSMPHQARLGIAVVLFGGLEVELDGTYEGWRSLDKMTITPHDVVIRGLGEDTPVQPIVISKHWVDAWSVRFGAEWRLPVALPWKLGVRLRGGLLWESSAIPVQYTSVDFANWDRFGETLGFSIDRDPLELAFSVGFLQQPDREVANSSVMGVGTSSELKPFAVGNGTYQSSYSMGWVGLRAHF